MEWWNLAFRSGLVNISARFSSVGTYSTEILLFLTASWMKWYWMSICLVWVCNLLSLDNAITPWLSHFSMTSLSNPLISPTNMCKYITSFVACICVMYSASVLNRVMMYCFFGPQVTAPVPMWNEYPRSSACAAVQPNPCHTSLWGSFFHTCQMSARGLWWFLGKQSPFLHLPSGPDPGFG